MNEPTAFPASRPIDDGFQPRLIVVGAGTAGMALAQAAADGGAEVFLLEKAHRIGGSLYLSSGMFSAGGTRRQAARGIADSPADHLADALRISRNTVDRDLTALYCEQAPQMVDFLDEHGFAFSEQSPAVLFGHEAYDRARIYWGAAGGRSIIQLYQRLLAPHVEAGRVRYGFGARADKLVSEHGRVVGVRAADMEYRAPAVVLTTGGYGSSPDLFARFHQGRRLVSSAAPTSTGDGLVLAEAAGAQLRGHQYFLPTVATIEDIEHHPGRMLQFDQDRWDVRPVMTPQVRLPWEIWVNQRGERFCREDEDHVDNRERRLLEQPDMRFWVIFDEAILDAAPPLVAGWSREQFDGFAAEGRLVKRADSLGALAYLMQSNALALQAAIDGYNLGVSSGVPDALGREYRPLPIGQGPFYAVRMQGCVLRTWAGIAVDTDLRALREDGTPIEGLYAAGEALGAATFSGDSFVAGMSVGPALALGRWLGARLAG